TTAASPRVDPAPDATLPPTTGTMADSGDGGEVPVAIATAAAVADPTPGDATEASDTEVLGVRIVAPPRTASTAPELAGEDEAMASEAPVAAAAGSLDGPERTGIHPLLLAALLAAALAAGFGVLRGTTRQPARSTARATTPGTTEGGPR
ncbi:MAG: hypothetical protein ACNA8R_14520, partial [Nitriliruptoraceae bacterium]